MYMKGQRGMMMLLIYIVYPFSIDVTLAHYAEYINDYKYIMIYIGYMLAYDLFFWGWYLA